MAQVIERFKFDSLCNDGEFEVQVTDNGNVVFLNDKEEAEHIHFGISQSDFLELIKYYKSKIS
jgi:hypothetical protein